MSEMEIIYFSQQKKTFSLQFLCVEKTHSKHKTYIEYNALVGIYCKLIHFLRKTYLSFGRMSTTLKFNCSISVCWMWSCVFVWYPHISGCTSLDTRYSLMGCTWLTTTTSVGIEEINFIVENILRAKENVKLLLGSNCGNGYRNAESKWIGHYS